MPALQLFLSYNNADRTSVIAVQKLLRARGITTFLDRDQLAAGLAWPQALEEGLREVSGVSVFIGRELGGWQKREMWFALDRQVREEKQGHAFPVIPVLLQGADLTPAFLFLNTWIDLRGGLDAVVTAEALDAFERAFAVSQSSAVQAQERAATICPYRGLQIFREEDSAFFVGRQAFSRRLLEFTLGKDLVAVVGPSGSGKSSVVQGGLVPLLRRERPPANTWDAVSFTPGNDPFHGLASALIPLLEQDLSETDRLTEAQKLGARLAGGDTKLEAVINRAIQKSNGTGRLLLVADQFEELFTLTPEVGRRPFAQALLRALGAAPFTLLVTLRADFYGQIIALDRELSDRLAPAQVNIGALSLSELRESIAAPAQLVGLEFEPGLVERILSGVGNEPGHLPLVEFALTELWQRRKGNLLTNQAYDEIGGATGALARRADAEFARLKPEEQTAARRLFGRLVRVARPEEAGEDTRQRTDLSDVDTIAKHVVKGFADARLLVTSGEVSGGTLSVEVAHEALIRNWERLRGWLNEDREFLLWRQRLQVQVDEWQEHKQDAGYLLRGAPLSEAERWLLGRPQDLAGAEQKFLGASVAARNDGLRKEMLRARRKLWIATGLAVFFAALTSLALFFWWSGTQQKRLAIARQLVSDSNFLRSANSDWTPAALLAMESFRIVPTFDAYEALVGSGLSIAKPVAVVRIEGSVEAVAMNGDGQLLATGSSDGALRVFEVRTGKELAAAELGNGITALAFSGDGQLVTAGDEGGTVLVFEARGGKELAQVELDDPMFDDCRKDYGRGPRVLVRLPAVLGVAFSPDGQLVAAGSAGGTLEVFEARGGKELPRPKFGVGCNDERELNVLPRSITAMSFTNEEGPVVTILSRDGVLLAFKARTGETLGRKEGLTELTNAVTFSADGTRVATVSPNGAVRVFMNLERPAELANLNLPVTPDDRFTSGRAIALSSDGELVAAGVHDGTVRLFEALGGKELARIKLADRINAVAFSGNRQLVAAGSRDGTVLVIEARNAIELARVKLEDLSELSDRSIDEAAFSDDGQLLATGSSEGKLQAFEVQSGKELAAAKLENGITALAFSADRQLIAAGSNDGTMLVFEARGGSVAGRAKLNGRVYQVDFSKDGQKLTAACSDGTIRVFQSRGGKELEHLEQQGVVGNVFAFSRDARLVAIGSKDGTVRVSQTRGGKLTAKVKLDSTLVRLALSHDGNLLATASEDKRIRIINISNQKQLARIPTDGTLSTLEFDDLAPYLRIVRRTGDSIVAEQYPLDQALIHDVCSRLTRNLTPSEWQQHLPGERPRITCVNLESHRVDAPKTSR